jgi:predicted TPR repeat methyltransferase
MENYKDSWKNKTVFEKQLELNIRELRGPIPSHWRVFLSFIKIIIEDGKTIKNILDIGCGCGTFSKLLYNNFPSIKYTGMDYAAEAVEIATRQWPFATFKQGDYQELTSTTLSEFDVVNACGLHNVLPDGDSAVEFLLDLNPKILILGKLSVTNRESYYETYQAYNEITTYKFFHNYSWLQNQFLSHGYDKIEMSHDINMTHFLLRKKEV